MARKIVFDAEVQQVLNRLAAAKQVVYDCETSGLDWKRQHIVGHVFTFSPNPADSFYLPVRHAAGGNIGGIKGPSTVDGWDEKLHPLEPLLLKAMDRSDLLVTGHNVSFDIKFLSRLGFKLRPRFEDTSINAPLLDEHIGKYSLEACAERAGVQAKKSAEIVKYLQSKFPEITNPRTAMGHYWRLAGDDSMGVEYAKGDGTSTWQLREVQNFEIEKQELQVVHDVESRLIPVLARMMIKGVRVDEERLDGLIVQLNKNVEILMGGFPSGFNARGKDDVRAWMEKHGHFDPPRTPPSKTFPQGQPSFPEQWLEKFEAGQKIVKVRKYENMLASFMVPLKERHLFKGRVHTQFNQLRTDDFGTVTGRLSSSDPNLQQVAKRNRELGMLFRSVFVPDSGMIWGSNDYQQCEPRLMAYYTRCKVLLHDYRTNPKADSHLAVTKAMYAAKWDQMDVLERKDARETGKRVNQTLITGGGKGVLTHKYGIAPRDVDKIWADYFRAMPEIRPFHKKASARYRARGYVLSLLGRRARLDDPNRDYTALNRLLQVGNADILKAKMVEIGEFLQQEGNSGVDMLLNCHDAIEFQFAEGSHRVYNQCRTIMADFKSDASLIKLDLPMPVDSSEGPNWSVATYGEQK